jgi:hypothetical protein
MVAKSKIVKAGKYRSGLEKQIREALDKRRVKYRYEEVKIPYIKPETLHSYLPDFILSNGIIVEAKGRFTSADRKKHLLIKIQHPELDIRFVFSNSRSRLSKTSKTTYGSWCEKHGFKYADKLIPISWIREKKKRKSV